MTDRRRKRKTTNSFADDTVKDFNAVDPVQARRRSDCSDHERGTRHESWMSKVSLAMSNRIFSGGKKLSGSRSTQVMPIGAALSDTSKTSTGRVSSVCSLQETDLEHISSSSTSAQQTLRLSASEKTLGRSKDPVRSSSPVTSLETCPDVTCDVASDDSDESLYDDDNGPRWSSRGSAPRRGESHRRGNTRRPTSSTVVQKVKPGEESDENDEMTVSSARSRLSPTGVVRPVGPREDVEGEVNVQDAAPILKGFFSRNVSVSKELREQQREQRRGSLYRESKQRQDKLREQTERDRVASEESRRREKVEQLRRLNQQRRKELLRDAASARKGLLERIQEDNDAFQAERESWEKDFEDEMQVLSQAFRKARASDENRPMTVAGLAVPEAISQLERDASNFEKRVKTAQPALATMPLHQRRTERSNTSGATSSMTDLASSPFFESCEVLALEDSKDVFDLFRDDDHASDLFPSKDSHALAGQTMELNLDLDQLLGEREKLLQRIAAIDRVMQSQQQ